MCRGSEHALATHVVWDRTSLPSGEIQSTRRVRFARRGS